MDVPSVLIVDNYDSFTYNLVHAVEAIIDSEVSVMRIDEVSKDLLVGYDVLIFSPGPGLPGEHGDLPGLLSEGMALKKRILGVCLGHQAMAMAAGAELKNLGEVHHGVSHPLVLCGESVLFKGIGEELYMGRYHSWVVNGEKLGLEWIITSRDAEGEIMSMEHIHLPFFGIQFHPESVLTPQGRKILENFLRL